MRPSKGGFRDKVSKRSSTCLNCEGKGSGKEGVGVGVTSGSADDLGNKRTDDERVHSPDKSKVASDTIRTAEKAVI
jgi:hypothetical protein